MADESVSRGPHNAVRELRGRWLNVPATYRCENKFLGSLEKTESLLGVREPGTRSASEGARKSRYHLRDFIYVDDEDGDNEMAGLLHSVPYVHFGV